MGGGGHCDGSGGTLRTGRVEMWDGEESRIWAIWVSVVTLGTQDCFLMAMELNCRWFKGRGIADWLGTDEMSGGK